MICNGDISYCCLLLSSKLQTFRWFKVTDNEVYFTISKILKNAIEIENEKKINTFVPNAPFLYPLKTSENLTVF